MLQSCLLTIIFVGTVLLEKKQTASLANINIWERIILIKKEQW